MTRESNVYLNDEARKALMRGVSKVADAVKGTLGAAGHNAILEKGLNPGHMITNDGVSIAGDVIMADPVENIGANLAKEISQKSDSESGDGTTTSIVLLEAILKEGAKSDAHPMTLKRSLDECIPIIHKAIDDQKRDITVDEVGKVAAISAESESLGALFQEIYQKIGKDGIVELDNSGTFDTYYDVQEGVRLRNCGYMASYMATDGTKAVYKKPLVLIARQKIVTISDLDPLFRQMDSKGQKELVIFCEDIDLNVLGALAITHVRGIFKTLIIKAPTLWRDWMIEDFAKITGATIVSPDTGVTWKNVSVEHLGTCEKIVTDKEETRVIGIKDISEHLAYLQEEGKKNDQMLLRASWLSTQVATLKLGANSESELSYIRLKAEDARNASHLALKDGVVSGGGLALLNATASLPNTEGGILLKEALRAPITQIRINASVENADVLQGVGALPSSIGFDANSLEWVDMWEAGIIDPASVVKNAVKNAISVAGTVLTSRVIITLPKEQINEDPGKMRIM